MSRTASKPPSSRDLLEGPWDLAVVGGGINGAGVAHDAARRGKSVVLLDKGDIGHGTSARSSKMLHGGIRYLEQFRFGLVHESLRERGLLLRLAPHLTRPQTFVIPIYKDAPRGPWMVRAGLFLYDLLALGRGIGRGKVLSAAQVAARVPDLLAADLLGGGVYHDVVMNDARLCLAVAQAAAETRPGGGPVAVRNYAEVTSLVPGSPNTLRVRDLVSGRESKLLARHVVRALGPWTEPEQLVRSKGIHLVLPDFPTEDGLLLSHGRDGRVFFLIPWLTGAVIGTTETPFDGSPDDVDVRPEEVRYLLAEVRRLFPKLAIGASDIRGTFAGIRPLARARPRGRGGAAGAVSRVHRIVREGTVFTVFGGKYTTFRAVAKDVVDRVFVGTRCSTHLAPLPGGEEGGLGAFIGKRGGELGQLVEREEIERLWRRYGSRSTRVLQLRREAPELALALSEEGAETAAEVVHGVREELVVYPEDFLARRTPLRYTAEGGRAAYGAIEDLVRRFSVTVPEDLDAARERYFAELEREESLRREVAALEG